MLDSGLGRAAVGWVGATGATPAASAQRAAIAGGVTGAEIPSLPRTAGRAHGRCWESVWIARRHASGGTGATRGVP